MLTNPVLSKLITKKSVLAIFITALLAITYLNFTYYSPKALRELREVRGYKSPDESIFSIPYPESSEKISDTRTESTRLITLKTNLSSQRIHEFYKSALNQKSFKIETEGEAGLFYTIKYKKEGDFITVSTSKQNSNQATEATIVSIKIEDNER